MLSEKVLSATPSGRIELKSEALARRWGAGALLPSWHERPADYPLMLISPASDKRITSTLGDLAALRKAPRLLMNPHDAVRRKLVHGVEVRVWNALGEVISPLDTTDDVPPGVVASEKGT